MTSTKQHGRADADRELVNRGDERLAPASKRVKERSRRANAFSAFCSFAEILKITTG